MIKHVKSGIYCIENKINNKKYIGQSINMKSRLSKHISELNRNCHENDYLQKSWNKYGSDNFKFYVLEYCEKDILDEREIYYIDMFDTTNRGLGYNLKSGGQEGNYYSEEVRQKMSESTKRTYLDPKRRMIQRNNALKQWSNPEIKIKISGKNNCMFGKTHTKEARKKISESKKGKQSFRRNTTPVFCIELNKEFKDASDASKILQVDSSSILKVCRGERKTCGGYHWKFKSMENNIS